MPQRSSDSSAPVAAQTSNSSRSNSRGRVLVVEDSRAEREALTRLLSRSGFTTLSAENADKAIAFRDQSIDVVLSDLHMGEVSGIDLLSVWKQTRPNTQFILLTGQSSIATAVQAIRAGAYDYITKPVDPGDLEHTISRAIDAKRKERELEDLRRRLDHKFGIEHIIGESPGMRKVYDVIRRAAPVDSTCLILGESGTGKELVAQALHHNSPRKDKPFVAMNVAAVPSTLVESELFGHVKGAFTGATDDRPGRFEQADTGTLFIDEIGDFELGLQAKLLRVLESLTVTPVGGHRERKVDVRVLAATSRNLRQMVQQGQFREDLFYRLNVVAIPLPPLRERVDDIPLLIEHFLKDIAQTRGAPGKTVSPEVVRAFRQYHWPGNVRELRNTLESMMVLAEGETLTARDLPDTLVASRGGVSFEVPAALTMDALERLAIEQALARFAGNRTHAANALKISVRTLQRKLAQYQPKEEAAAANMSPGM